MSVDNINTGQVMTNPSSANPRHDLIVFIGGWGGASNSVTAQPLNGTRTGTGQLVAQAQRMRLRSQVHHILALEGGDNAGTQAVNWIRQNFNPFGRVIVYGYSAGGVEAMEACREISRLFSIYDFSARQLTDRIITGHAAGRVRIDLLVTVDPAFGIFSSQINRSVPPSVRLNLNYYQTTSSNIGSYGGPNQAIDAARTRVVNENLTARRPGITHSDIDEVTNQRVLAAIRHELSAGTP